MITMEPEKDKFLEFLYIDLDYGYTGCTGTFDPCEIRIFSVEIPNEQYKDFRQY